jgi:hypothetical protein
LANDYYGIWVNGSDNRFVENSFASVPKKVVDTGQDNEFA